MDSSSSNDFEAELKGQTPDSGVDMMSKFNILDFILLDNSNATDVIWDTSMTDAPVTSLKPNTTEPGGSGSDKEDLFKLSTSGTSTGPGCESLVSEPKSVLPPLRTLSKQELQRMKALEDSKREKEVQSALQPPPQSTPVDLPNSTLSSSPQVTNIPRNLLRVETRLENPTKYHLQQCVRNNIARYSLESANVKGGSVPPQVYNTHSGALNELRPQASAPAGPGPHGTGSAPPNIFHSPLSPPVTHGPTSVPPQSINSSVATSITSGCSDLIDPMATLDVDSELNMFSLSEINELITSQDADSVFNYPLPPTNFSASNSSEAIGGQGSSTPLHSPGTPQDDSVRAVKDRQKKDNHNKIERRRRYLINDMITLQGQQLPKQNEPYYEKFGDVKQNKGAILQASVDYIQILKDDNESFRHNESKAALKIQQTEQEKRKLLLRIQELEQLCSQNGIDIPNEALTWRPQQPERITSLINSPITIKQEPKFCELMEEGNPSIVTGACDPMLGQVEDLVTIDGDDFPVGMELS